jgi:RNA polymerase sigma-70 factor (ECF subfamily)
MTFADNRRMPDDEPLPENEAPAPQAAGEVFDRFARRLIALARVHVDVRLQHKIDPEDVVQSVYKSFLLRYKNLPLDEESAGGLWSLLTLITLRKCADRVRYYRAECRDVAREATPHAETVEPWREAIGREPTPEQAAMLAETLESLLRDLSSQERPVVELSLQGYSTQEIGERLGRAERSVRRLRERVRRQLERLNS